MFPSGDFSWFFQIAESACYVDDYGESIYVRVHRECLFWEAQAVVGHQLVIGRGCVTLIDSLFEASAEQKAMCSFFLLSSLRRKLSRSRAFNVGREQLAKLNIG